MYSQESSGEDYSNNQTFDDTLDFNAWQLTPAFPKPYRDIIGKDAPLSNINNQRDMEQIDTNLRIATYLSGMMIKVPVGWTFITKEDEEPILLEVDTKEEGEYYLRGKTIIGVQRLYDERPMFTKSVHNKLSRAYTRMALSRGINGQAAKDLKTVRSEESKQLIDLTNRGGFNLFKKKSPTHWSNYEMQK